MAALLVDSGAGTAAAACAADLGGGGGGGGGSGGAAAGAGATASRQGEFRREPPAARDAAWEQRVADSADPDFDRRHARWAVPSAAAGQAPTPVPGRVNGGAIGRPHPHSPAAAAAAAAAAAGATAAATTAAAHAQQQHHSAVAAGAARRCCRQRQLESRCRCRAIHVATRRHRMYTSGRRWGGVEAPRPGRRCGKRGGTLNSAYLATREPSSFLKLAVALPDGARAVTDAACVQGESGSRPTSLLPKSHRCQRACRALYGFRIFT